MIENAISTNENLVQDISNELIYGHTHNGVKCAVCPTAKRACDRAWFSAKQIEEWSEMSTMTLNRRLHDLEECERILRLSDLVNVDIPTETGAVKTTSPSQLPRHRLESTRIGRDSRLCFLPLVGENENPTKNNRRVLACLEAKSKTVPSSSLMWMPTSWNMSRFH